MLTDLKSVILTLTIFFIFLTPIVTGLALSKGISEHSKSLFDLMCFLLLWYVSGYMFAIVTEFLGAYLKSILRFLGIPIYLGALLLSILPWIM